MLCAKIAVPGSMYGGCRLIFYSFISAIVLPGHAKLEVVTKLALPEPELQFSTNGDTSKGVVIGMGDVNIGIEEFNLLLEY